MDRAQIWALKRRHCFADGWGDLSSAEDLAAMLRDASPPPSIRPDVGPATTVLGAELRIGTFQSPEDRLPAETREARFWWLHPADTEVRGVITMFASWGDEGPTMRGRIVGQLVREGVSIVLLENPFYGVRRREGQKAQGLRTVADFVLMQAAAWQEGFALHTWARRQVDGPAAVVGFSMGGHLAAALAGAIPGAVPAVIAAPPLCPSEPFADGPLGCGVDWDQLGGDNEATRRAWTELMDLYHLQHLPRPTRPELTRIIGCSRDGLVPSVHAQELADLWGAPLEWQPVGHVGIVLARSRVVRSAIRDVLGITEKGRRPALAGAVERT